MSLLKNKKPAWAGFLRGGESEIRTHGTLRFASFQDWCLKPLGHLSMLNVQRILGFRERVKKSGPFYEALNVIDCLNLGLILAFSRLMLLF
jgi:hypothetical protein